jgi:MtN3 and saliva related transmembrane protein
MLLSIIGFLATITSTISLIPQVVKTFKTKSTEDLSMLMLWNFLGSSILWLIYGILINSWAIVSSNFILTVFSCWLLILKFKYA